LHSIIRKEEKLLLDEFRKRPEVDLIKIDDRQQYFDLHKNAFDLDVVVERGVKIREEGRIGAEKIFNYIRRFDYGDTQQALIRAVGIIKKRTRHIRGMNIIMVNEAGIFVSSYFT
jgi:hypothetical protein